MLTYPFEQGVGEFTDIQTSPLSTQITFKDRKTAEKFMATFTAGDVGAEDGSVEASWVKNSYSTPTTHTPSLSGAATPMDVVSGPVSGSQAQQAALGGGNSKPEAPADTEATKNSTTGGAGNGQRDSEMDYDVGDENDWEN